MSEQGFPSGNKHDPSARASLDAEVVLRGAADTAETNARVLGDSAHIGLSMIQAKGDTIAGSGVNGPARLASAATSGHVLTADPAQPLGVKWAAAPGSTGGIPNEIIDAKGDVIVGSAADGPARLPVGADGLVLTASATTTYGVAWASGGTGSDAQPRCSLTLSASAGFFANGSNVAVVFGAGTEDYDTSNMHDTAVNPTRVTATTAGLHLVTGVIGIGAAAAAAGQVQARIHLNGALFKQCTNRAISNTINNIVEIVEQVYLNAGDYVELFYFQSSGAPIDGAGTTHFAITRLTG